MNTIVIDDIQSQSVTNIRHTDPCSYLSLQETGKVLGGSCLPILPPSFRLPVPIKKPPVCPLPFPTPDPPTYCWSTLEPKPPPEV